MLWSGIDALTVTSAIVIDGWGPVPPCSAVFTASRSYLRLVVAEVIDLTGALDTDLSRIEAADELVGEERTAPYVFAPGVVNTWFKVGPLSGNNAVAVP